MDPHFPVGCIGARALRALAKALDKLDGRRDKYWSMSDQDRPCLRRIEIDGDRIVAHISTGPAVGGSWSRLVLIRGAWVMEQE